MTIILNMTVQMWRRRRWRRRLVVLLLMLMLLMMMMTISTMLIMMMLMMMTETQARICDMQQVVTGISVEALIMWMIMIPITLIQRGIV